jgi:hypothetical protein
VQDSDNSERDSLFIYIHIYIYLFIYLLTAIGLMPGGSFCKDKVHERPQYNTVHIYKYNTST